MNTNTYIMTMQINSKIKNIMLCYVCAFYFTKYIVQVLNILHIEHDKYCATLQWLEMETMQTT